MKRREVGILGEKLAKDFFKKRGYGIVRPTTAAYLNGLGEAAGEFRRYLLDGMRRVTSHEARNC